MKFQNTVRKTKHRRIKGCLFIFKVVDMIIIQSQKITVYQHPDTAH